MSKWEDRLCTAIAIILIIGLEVVFAGLIYRPWTLSPNPGKTLLMVLIHVSYIMLVSSYIACFLTPPGGVPKDYDVRFILNESGRIISTHSIPLKDMPRWCAVCARPKPPRAHHCSACQTCVLRMDHHCPWMGGRCIGFYNHGHFLRFLWWTSICIAFSVFAAAWWFTDYYVRGSLLNYGMMGPDWRLPLFILSAVTALGVLGFVGILGGWHLRAVIINRTTIETMEEEMLKRQLTRDQLKEYQFPYKLDDPLENARWFLGERRWFWWLPVERPSGDGTVFPVHPDAPFDGQWPVRFKDIGDAEDHSAKGDLLTRESEDYRRRIRRDSEGFLLPKRLFPELYPRDVVSEPHLIPSSDVDLTRRRPSTAHPRIN